MKFNFYIHIKNIFIFLYNPKYFSNYFRSRLKYIFIYIFFTTLLEIIGIGLVIPLLIFILEIDNSSINNSNWSKLLIILNFNNSKFNIIFLSVLTIIIIYYIKNILIFKFYHKTINFTYNTQLSLSKLIFEYYLKYSFLNLKNISSSEIIRNITSETNAYVSSLQQSIILINEFVVFTILILLLFLVDFNATIIILLFYSIIIFFFNFFLKKKIMLWGALRIESEQTRLSNIQKSLKSILEIKLYNIQKFFITQFQKSNITYSDVSKKQDIVNFIPRLTLEILLISTLALIIIYSYFSNKNLNEIIISLTTFSLVAFRLMPSINRMIMSFQTIRFYHESLINIKKIFDSSKFDQIFGKKKIMRINNIKFINISYRYGEKKPKILNNLNLEMKIGEIIGIKGQSGSGKTTIINILLNLITNYEGKVLFDGVDIKTLDIGKIVSYVPQKIAIIDDTILNNIFFGSSIIDEKFALELINKLDLKNVFDLNSDNKIGELSTIISGGQEQRIALARALYRKPKLLILDESTNSLDQINESVFFKYLNEFKSNMIILNISHSDNSLKNCNKIYDLKNGKLFEI